MKESILYIGSENSFLQDADVPVKFFSPETQRPSIDELLTLCSQKGITAVLAPSKYIDIASPLLWHSDTVSKYILLDTEDFRLNESFNSRITARIWYAVAMQADSGDSIGQSAWKKSDTGETFSTQEMNELSDNVLAKLKPYLTPQSNILEIGVGSGLLCRKIAPSVHTYYGSDFSAESLKKTAAMLKEYGITNTELFTGEAMTTRDLAIPEVDVIIINSVAQYFPGKNYFLNVLASAVDKLKTSGVIFVGDIIDYDKRDDYGKIHKAKREQYYSRSFITSIPYYVDGVAGVDVSDKLGTIQNELMTFRYDALLTVNKSAKHRTPTQGMKHRYAAKLMNEDGKVSLQDVISFMERKEEEYRDTQGN